MPGEAVRTDFHCIEKKQNSNKRNPVLFDHANVKYNPTMVTIMISLSVIFEASQVYVQTTQSKKQTGTEKANDARPWGPGREV